MIDPAIQADLLAGLGGDVVATPRLAEKQQIIYERNKPRAPGTVNDQGLRFDETVPVETIQLGASVELAQVPEHQPVIVKVPVASANYLKRWPRRWH